MNEWGKLTNVWLPWDDAILIAVPLSAVGVTLQRSRSPKAALVRPFVWETIVVLLLYALWQWAGRFNFIPPDDALARGLRIWELQRFLPLPTEVWVQQVVLGYPWLVQASNIYYFVVHVPAMIATLIWLFARYRHLYRPVRNVLAITTGASLLAHLVPVAPPRMMPELGFVDTGLLYNQSAYGPAGSGVSNQLGALPSVHVLWAALVAVAIWLAYRGTTSRWRWLGVAHLGLTILAVTDTANHWWADSILAIALIPPAWWLQKWVRQTGVAKMLTNTPGQADRAEVDEVVSVTSAG